MEGPDYLFVYKRELVLRVLRKSAALLEASDDGAPIPYKVIENAVRQALESDEVNVDSVRASEALLEAYTGIRKATPRAAA